MLFKYINLKCSPIFSGVYEESYFPVLKQAKMMIYKHNDDNANTIMIYYISSYTLHSICFTLFKKNKLLNSKKQFGIIIKD